MKDYKTVRNLTETKWAVVGFDYNTAKQLISDIEEFSGKDVLKRIHNKYELSTYFADGTVLRWVSARENIKGFKFAKMWCDKNVNEKVFERVIMSMYYGKREDIIWI